MDNANFVVKHHLGGEEEGGIEIWRWRLRWRWRWR